MNRALLSRRHLLAGAGATALVTGAMVEPRAATKETPAFACPADGKVPDLVADVPDPIFTAIERTRETWDALGLACTASDSAMLAHGTVSIEYESAYADQEVVSDQHWEALANFLSTVPTTLPGVIAYIDFLAENAGFGGCAIEAHQYEMIVASLKGAVLRYVDRPPSTAPIAEAVPVTRELLENYDAWLVHEHRRLNAELGNRGCVRANIPGSDYHMPGSGFPETPSPSTRAARVLAAVGCPLAWEA